MKYSCWDIICFLSGQGRGVYLALCQSGASQSEVPRIRTQDQGLFGCPPGTIWAPDKIFCSSAQPYHRTVLDGGITAGMGQTTQSLYEAICLFGPWRVTSSGFELKTKVFLVALLIPSKLIAQMVSGGQRPKPQGLQDPSSNPGEATL